MATLPRLGCHRSAKKVTDQPSLIVAKTSIAAGAPTKVGSASLRVTLGEEVIKGSAEPGLPEDEKFFIPDEPSLRSYAKARRGPGSRVEKLLPSGQKST